MIEIIKLQNFRRHESLTVNFSTGLNVIRGANEAGKSTLIEAALYALYGAKALRDPLAETVTWGAKESSLKVELVIRISDRLYIFTRSKNGAECKADDGALVTGQGEVSAYAAELLGADARTASSLMLSSQSGLRGALDEGPAAVSALMAKLADFDIVDKILENANQRLLLGSVAPLQNSLNDARSRVESLQAIKPHDETMELLPTRIEALKVGLKGAEEQLAEKQRAVAVAGQEMNSVLEGNTQHVRARDRVVSLETKLQTEKERFDRANAKAAQRPSADEIGLALANADHEADFADRVKHYGLFKSALASYSDVFWEGTQEALLKEIDAAHEASKAAEVALAEARMKARDLQARMRTSGKCPTCGRSDHNEEEIAAHNAAVRAEIDEVGAIIKVREEAVTQAAQNVKVFKKLVETSDAYMAKLSKIKHIVLNYSTVPPKPEWALEVPSTPPDGSAARELARLQTLDQDCLRAQGEASSLTLSMEATRLDLQAARETLEMLPFVNEEQAHIKLSQASQAAAEAGRMVSEIRGRIESDQDQYRIYQARLKSHQEQVTSLLQTCSMLEQQIAETEKNNALVNKLKKIKPAITDHLWGITLGAVSTFFSQMRGEQSVVSKDKDGFRVNGRSAQSLSGSTLDVLALAIRVALTRTFIPHASFIVLDEPAHGCDSSRTGNVLGFLSGTGFPQTVLASHDDLSESVADNVISLGA